MLERHRDQEEFARATLKMATSRTASMCSRLWTTRVRWRPLLVTRERALAAPWIQEQLHREGLNLEMEPELLKIPWPWPSRGRSRVRPAVDRSGRTPTRSTAGEDLDLLRQLLEALAIPSTTSTRGRWSTAAQHAEASTGLTLVIGGANCSREPQRRRCQHAC